MKTLLLTLTLLAAGPPNLSDRATALTQKHGGKADLITSELITWLYAEGGKTEVLSGEEIYQLKELVRLKCGAFEANLKAKNIPTKKLENRPVRAWYNNVALTITYANGASYTYTLQMYGYIDPANPARFVFDPVEQSDYVKRLLNAPAPTVQPQYYYILPRGSS